MVACDDEVQIDDEVVLIGEQGADRITADDVAGWAGTISYEIVCGISARVPRRYFESTGV
jgi:alanine racemase